MKNATQTYQIKTTKFGKWEKVILSNGINEIAFVPAFGGHLLALKMEVQGRPTNILDGYTTPTQLEKKDYYKSSLLLPFPNRLRDGKYQFEGKTYQFPINNPDTQNNLHGFDDFYNMSIKNVDLNEDYASVSLFSSYQGQNSSYPFPFNFTITYTLSGYNELECTIHIFNPNNYNIPIGVGWHPYFKLDSKVDDLELKMPDSKLVKVCERMLPTGKLKAFETFVESKKIGNTSLDNCFILNNKIASAEIQLTSSRLKTQITYWQEADKFPYYQIFTPPHRNAIAIEPMTCNVDGFNNKDGLLILSPGERFAGKFGVKVRSVY